MPKSSLPPQTYAQIDLHRSLEVQGLLDVATVNLLEGCRLFFDISAEGESKSPIRTI